MQYKTKELEQYRDQIHEVVDDQLTAVRRRLARARLERDLIERREQSLLNELARESSVDLDSTLAKRREWQRQRWQLSREMVAEYLYLKRRINPNAVPPRSNARDGVVQSLLAAPRASYFDDCVAVSHPTGLQFLHSWCTDDFNGVTLTGVGVDFSGGGLTSMRYGVDLYGPYFLTLEATWGLVVPNAALCGFEISTAMTVEGFVDNKATRSVGLEPMVQINQFRSNRPLDQVEASSDPLVSGVWGGLIVDGVPTSDHYHTDAIYGFHWIGSLRSELTSAYGYAGHEARVRVQAGDRLIISAHLTLDIDEYSYAFLDDPRPQPAAPYYGGVVFQRPSITFFGTA
jgi:hypothetical protein